MAINTGIPNATVIIIRKDRRYAIVAQTDERGIAVVKLPPGDYDVFVVKTGYVVHHQVVSLYRDMVKYVDLREYYIERVIYAFAPEYAYYYPLTALEGAYYALYYHPESFQMHVPFIIAVLNLTAKEGKLKVVGPTLASKYALYVDKYTPKTTVSITTPSAINVYVSSRPSGVTIEYAIPASIELSVIYGHV